MKSSKGKTTTYKAISTSLSAEFLGRNCGIEEKGSVHLNWWKGGTYKQDDPTQQGSQSESTEKQEASQTSKRWGNSAPAKQLCKTLCDPVDYTAHGILPTQGSNPGLPHCRRILYQLSCKRSPKMLYKTTDAERTSLYAENTRKRPTETSAKQLRKRQ